MKSVTANTQIKEQQRFFRFLVVGAGGTLLDFTLLTLLKLAGLATLPANTLSFTAGLINNFYWNRRWTFADSTAKAWGPQLLQFSLVSLIGLILNNLVIFFLEAPLGAWLPDPTWGYLPAKVLATGLVVFWNFFANRYWTFQSAVSEPAPIPVSIPQTNKR